jgi:hypothetical protein
LSAFFPVNLSSPNHGAAVGEGSGNARWRRLVQNALLLVTLASITGFYAVDYDKRAKGTDFPDFYTAARMVRDGYGRQLYDFQAQDRFQILYAGRTGTYYVHPPFETLLYLPLSLWSLQTAYLLWCVLNAAVLTYTAIVFQKHVFNLLNWRILLPLFLLFPPVLLNFQQGQDSLLLLLIMTLAVVELTRNRNFSAGCLLGCGLFKFRVILSLVVLLVLLRRRGLLRGFALVFVILLLISAGCQSLLFLPPLHLILLSWHVYAYASIPILIMFLVTSAGIGRNVRLSNAEDEDAKGSSAHPHRLKPS